MSENQATGNDRSVETGEVGSQNTESVSGASSSPTETHEHTPAPSAPGIPKRIGQYRIKRAIASGGMGTVYEALQEKPRRTVAVKLMRARIASRSALRRFEYESQLLARLRHNGIAQVYDAGTHRDGEVVVPYFAMEYIVGAKPITEYVRDKKLGTHERMKLFADVCEAVHHGHQKGIIHRDLKPSNILVDSSGQVKVIDFGVARSTDSDMAVTTLQTDVGQLIGTLQYMSPEQCAADPHDIDTRSDVYALGVILFEMLCEHLPYEVRGAAIHEATRVIREQAPMRLSTLNRTLRGDVETIALKALEKERDRRYQSAVELSQDVERYLNGEAISARRASAWYQFKVFALRNRTACLAVLIVMITLVGATIVSSVQYLRADAERQRAVTAETRALGEAEKSNRVVAFLQNMLSSANPFESGDRNLRVVDMLDRAAETVGAELSRQPEVEAMVRRTMGETYFGLSLFGQAETELRESIKLATTVYGEEHAFVADTLQTLFWVMEKSGQYQKAEDICKRALAIRRRLYGEQHPAVADSLDNLGNIYRFTGDMSRAEESIRQAHEIYGELGGEVPYHHLNNFGVILRDAGKFDESESLLRQAILAAGRALGVDHPHTNHYRANLALMLDWNSRFAEAEPLYRRSVDGMRNALGPTHQLTLMVVHHLADNEARRGLMEQAEVNARESVEGYRQISFVENVEYAHALGILGMILNRLDGAEEAEPYLREAVDLRQHLAAQSWRMFEAMSLLGESLAMQRKFAEAEPLLLKSYDRIREGVVIPYAAREALDRVIALYELWLKAEPGKGYDAKAAEWRAKLPREEPGNGN